MTAVQRLRERVSGYGCRPISAKATKWLGERSGRSTSAIWTCMPLQPDRRALPACCHAIHPAPQRVAVPASTGGLWWRSAPPLTCFSAAGCFACRLLAAQRCRWTSADVGADFHLRHAARRWGLQGGPAPEYRLRANEAFILPRWAARALRLEDKDWQLRARERGGFRVVTPT